ncbi:MAG: biotin/lipoyl-containing protein [Kofleriaceae bacterium]
MSARRHAPTVEALVLDDAPAGTILLGAPGPGWFVAHHRRGDVVGPGARLGTLEVLGRKLDVVVPAGAAGALVGDAPAAARIAVGFRQALCTLDPTASAQAGAVTRAEASDAAGGLVFRAPSGGRFYGRPGPGKPTFVTVGDVIGAGQTVCMLEVMKTFHRVNYGGDGLPARARVDAILVADDADVDRGTPLLRISPA